MTDILLFFGLLLLGLGVVASVWREHPPPHACPPTHGESHRSLWSVAIGTNSGGPFVSRPIPSLAVDARPPSGGADHFALGWALPFVIAVGLIVSLLGTQLESYLASQRTAKIETQLADAIDLMVAAVGAGAGIGDALENAMSRIRRPLRPPTGRSRRSYPPRGQSSGGLSRPDSARSTGDLCFSRQPCPFNLRPAEVGCNFGKRRQDDS